MRKNPNTDTKAPRSGAQTRKAGRVKGTELHQSEFCCLLLDHLGSET